MSLRILYLEPLEGGSHAAFTRALTHGVEAAWELLTLPGRHWKWRMRGAVPYFVLQHAAILAQDYDLIFASAYTPLAELRGLVPGLARCPAVLYFHENQLAYPVRAAHSGERDAHFGVTQMISALAATRVVFNSRYNHDSFLDGASQLLARMPDARPEGWVEAMRARSVVLPLPLALPGVTGQRLTEAAGQDRSAGPLILWNHRWEHDKNPEVFFAALRVLMQRQVPFRVAVCGHAASTVPPVFEHARAWLGGHVVHWGYAASEEGYHALLRAAHIAVSTANQEFFGVSMLEATHAGALPLVPDRLSYRELFPAAHCYQGDAALFDALEAACRSWTAGASLRADRRAISGRFEASAVLPLYAALFDETIAAGAPGG